MNQKKIQPPKYVVILDGKRNLHFSWNQRKNGKPSRDALRCYVANLMGTLSEPKERAQLVLNNQKAHTDNPEVLFEIEIDADLKQIGLNRRKISRAYRIF